MKAEDLGVNLDICSAPLARLLLKKYHSGVSNRSIGIR